MGGSKKVSELRQRKIFRPTSAGFSALSAWLTRPVGRADVVHTAEVGKETFEADIKLALPTGRILSASMDNPVDVLARECIDAARTVCGDPVRYRIRRHITLEADGQAILPAATK